MKGYSLLELILILVITGFLVIGASYTYINSRNSNENRSAQVALMGIKSAVFNNLVDGVIPQSLNSLVVTDGFSLTSEASNKYSEVSYYIVNDSTAILSSKTSTKCIIFKFNFVGKSGWATSSNNCKASDFANSEIDGKEDSPRVLS